MKNENVTVTAMKKIKDASRKSQVKLVNFLSSSSCVSLSMLYISLVRPRPEKNNLGKNQIRRTCIHIVEMNAKKRQMRYEI